MTRLLATITVFIALGLTACAADSGPSLAGSKSPAQLLRTETVDRLPDYLFAEPEAFGDVSVSCREVDEDPNQLYRSWQSTAEIVVFDAATMNIDTVVDDLVETFIEQGWVDRSLGEAGVQHSRFIANESSHTLLRVTSEPLGIDALAVTDEGADGARIVVESTGPCVLTDGPDSDEVKKLEKRS